MLVAWGQRSFENARRCRDDLFGRPKQSQTLRRLRRRAARSRNLGRDRSAREEIARCHGARPEVKIDLERVRSNQESADGTGENRIAIMITSNRSDRSPSVIVIRGPFTERCSSMRDCSRARLTNEASQTANVFRHFATARRNRSSSSSSRPSRSTMITRFCA